jgi:thioredoxin reductase (NADPH)
MTPTLPTDGVSGHAGVVHKATQLILGDDKNPHTVVVSEVNGTSLTDGADKKYKAGAVVIASGRTWKMFTDKDVEGIEQVTGRGVYYIVLPGDVSHTKDANVVIVGGSDAAGEAALALGDQPKLITMVVRGKFEITVNDLKKYITDRINMKKIIVLQDSVVTKCVADSNNELTSVVVSNSKTGAVKTISTTWMYCLIGSRPNSDWIKNAKIALSTTGAVLTGYNAPSTQSSVPGIYAIGDVQYGAVPRVGSAVGKGAVVIAELSDYRAQHPTLFPSGRQSVGYFGVEERV